MTDEQQGAFILPEGADQGLDTGHVEVGGGLIHQQEIRRIKQQFYKGQPALFATAQYGDTLEHVIAAKQERAQDRPRGLFTHRLGGVEHFLQYRHFGIKHINAMLGIVTDLDVQAEFARSLLDREHAGQQF